MSIRCPKCHTDNPNTKQFCGDCGSQLPSSKDMEVTETIEVPTEELTSGSTFAGRYQIIEELGKGGMGRIYRALDKEVNATVALKLIKPEIASDQKAIERFRNELKVTRDIAHKNVCRMYDLGREGKSYFITMEYVSGEDLKSLIRRAGIISIGKAISIINQVCEGLSEAHKLGVVHRDLKPHNIMIDREGNAKVMDFGIASILGVEGITVSGMMMGSPAYMSPEQAEGKEVDQRADLYSVGVILYEMVTGRVPFEGDTVLSVAMKHKGEAPKDPREYNAQIPDELSKVVLKCLEKNRKNRYQGAEELLNELSNIEKGLPTTTKAAPGQKHKTGKSGEVEWQSSIAVLPFMNMSADPEQEYFCDGIAEEIINALSHIESLRVIARTSAFVYKDKNEDVREIGRKLDAETLLEGSVRKAGNRLRITAQLVNAEDGSHLWSDRYDRSMEDIFAIQDEISLAIVDNLKLKLLGKEKAILLKRHSDNPEAYNIYLKGRYFWNRRKEEEMKKGIEFFNQAMKMDPLFPLPYVGIADALMNQGVYGFLPPKEAFPKAMALSKKALEMDETLAEAHASLGYAYFLYDWDWEAAENEFNQTFDLNPNYAQAHMWYSVYLLGVGRGDEGISEAKRALELEPLSLPFNAYFGTVLFFARQYDESIEQFQKTIEMDPSFQMARVWLGDAYVLNSMWEEAIAEFQKVLAVEGNMIYALGMIGWVYALSGQKDEAFEIYKRLNELSKDRYVSHVVRSLIPLGQGDMDKTFEHLEKALFDRDPQLVIINQYPTWDTVRADPRFAEILKKLGLEQKI
jgi:serine/threonine protein kinase